MQIPSLPRDPVPLVPHHEHVVDGAHLTLRWEPAPGAQRYRVPIAPDVDFHEVVFEQDLLADVTALVVRPQFPDDDRTFYWRVLAGNAGGWSEGERIESFISGTSGQADRFVDLDEAEPFGPVAALFSVASMEALAEVLPGRQRGLEAALGEEHPEGVEAAELFNVEVGLLVAAGLVIGALLFLLMSAC